MHERMLSWPISDNQIRDRAVVRLVSIDMMDALSCRQISTDMTLHYAAMVSGRAVMNISVRPQFERSPLQRDIKISQAPVKCVKSNTKPGTRFCVVAGISYGTAQISLADHNLFAGIYGLRRTRPRAIHLSACSGVHRENRGTARTCLLRLCATHSFPRRRSVLPESGGLSVKRARPTEPSGRLFLDDKFRSAITTTTHSAYSSAKTMRFIQHNARVVLNKVKG